MVSSPWFEMISVSGSVGVEVDGSSCSGALRTARPTTGRGRIERKRLRRIRRRTFRLRQFVHEHERVCPLPPQVHAPEIEENAIDPGGKGAPPVVLVDLRHDLRKRAKDQVLRIR